MPRKMPPIHGRIKKGEVRNPLGSNAHDPQMKMIKRLTKDELIEVGNLVIKNNVEELKAIGKDPNASVLKTMIASVAVKVIQKGDMHALDILLNRLIGKVKDEVQVSSDGVKVELTLPSNGSEAET